MPIIKPGPFDAKYLRSILFYGADTGFWFWLKDNPPYYLKGSRAGIVDCDSGYRRIRIDGREYQSSILAYLYIEGTWPHLSMDHINRIRDDDKWKNLRLATKKEQRENSYPKGQSPYSYLTTRRKIRNKELVDLREQAKDQALILEQETIVQEVVWEDWVKEKELEYLDKWKR